MRILLGVLLLWSLGPGRVGLAQEGGGNSAPEGVRGPHQRAFVGDWVELDARASRDADGDSLHFLWRQRQGPSVTLRGAKTAQPRFKPRQAGRYVFELQVSDGNAAAKPVLSLVEVRANLPPVLQVDSPVAGARFLVGTTVELRGSGSDAEDGVLADSALVWRSSLDKVLGRGRALSLNRLRAGKHVLTLEGRDSRGVKGTASVSIVVRTNTAPQGVVEAVEEAFVGDVVVLDGSASIDADGDSLSFVWQQRGGPSTSLAEASAAKTSFTPQAAGTYGFVVQLSDGQGGQSQAEVAVQVRANQVPVLTLAAPVAGARFLVGTAIELRGSGSDAEDGALVDSALVWHSSLDGVLGRGQQLSVARLQAGEHVLSLEGFDSRGGKGTATVAINVRVNSAPIANAGFNQQVIPGGRILLNGTASSDVDGDSLSYIWRQRKGPSVTLFNATSPQPSFTPKQGGVYVFQLIVNDGMIASKPALVAVKAVE